MDEKTRPTALKILTNTISTFPPMFEPIPVESTVTTSGGFVRLKQLQKENESSK